MTREEIEWQVVGFHAVNQRLVPAIECSGRATHLDVGISFVYCRSGRLVYVEVVIDGASEESVFQVGFVPYLNITVGISFGFPFLCKPLVDCGPGIEVGGPVHKSTPFRWAALQQGGCVAMRYYKHWRVSLCLGQQVVDVGKVVRQVFCAACDTRLSVEVVFAAGHLVAHGACLEFCKLWHVAGEPFLRYERSLVETYFLHQRVFCPLITIYVYCNLAVCSDCNNECFK